MSFWKSGMELNNKSILFICIKNKYCKEKGLIKAWKNYLKFIQGKYLGIKPKSFCHNGNPGCYHKPVWIWIYNDNNEFLIQKRASCKKRSPNK